MQSCCLGHSLRSNPATLEFNHKVVVCKSQTLHTLTASLAAKTSKDPF